MNNQECYTRIVTAIDAVDLNSWAKEVAAELAETFKIK
jgi:hypothetical protein